MSRLKQINPDQAMEIVSQALGPHKAAKLHESSLREQETERPFWWAEVINRITGDIGADPWRVEPVDIETFLFDPFYLGIEVGTVWPLVQEHLVALNSGLYYEGILTGAIGTAKTTIALWTQIYQLYRLSCLKSPQRHLGIQRSDEIVFIFQNLSERQAKAVDYARFKAMVDASPYFTKEFPYDPQTESFLKFPHRIECRPATGRVTSTIGQNVFGGILDEVNFMEVTEGSKKARDDGVYDQAMELYNSISMRRKSRFMDGGEMPGVFCIVSSRNYPGQFTDKKEAEAQDDIRRTGKTGIYVYDEVTWDLRPERFGKERFRVFIGDEKRKPRLLHDDERTIQADLDEDLVRDVPVELRGNFVNDIHQALRDILGVATQAQHPFIPNVEAIAKCFTTPLVNLSSTHTDFEFDRIKVYPKRFTHHTLPRWTHVDLGLRSDAAGVASGYVPEFRAVERASGVEVLPVIVLDFVLEVNPPAGGEILFWKIRELLKILKDREVNMKWVSFDSWQSIDSQQILRQWGFRAGTQSIDKDIGPYEICKGAILDGRLHGPQCEKVVREFRQLQRVAQGKKIIVDHPPQGSKDISDAVAGVVYGLTMRRETWLHHNIPLGEIPSSVSSALNAAKDRVE